MTISKFKQKKILFLWYFPRLFVTFTLGEGTFARKNKEKTIFLWFFARLFVPLTP